MSDSKKKHPGGRPTKYRAEFCHEAREHCLCGATDAQLAKLFGITETTLYRWKREKPEFRKAIQDGKDYADAKVANALYLRALGYSHPEDKIFPNGGKDEDGNQAPMIVPTIKHYPPDTAAAFIWLKNRRPDMWRDRREVEFKGNRDIEDMSLDEIRDELARTEAAIAERTGKAKGGSEQLH